MKPENYIALFAALVAATVAVVVPLWTFKRTLSLEAIKWARDQRAQLYVDMLAEAYAEKQWFLELMTSREISLIEASEGDDRRGPSGANFPPGPDLRLGAVERNKLGARGAVFASPEVSILFNAFNGALGRQSLLPPKSEGAAHLAKIQAEELFDALSTGIRDELGVATLVLPKPAGAGRTAQR